LLTNRKFMINKILNTNFFGRIFHTLNYCLKRELKDCETVLDLGCGPSSPLQYCKNIKHSVGVEAFKPYLEEARQRAIHSEYLERRIEELDFPENSFDAVIMLEVLEHLPKEIGFEIIKKADKWAKKKVVISTPNGFFPMEDVDDNDLQRHLSGWTPVEFKGLGFAPYGLSGVKGMYLAENAVESLVEGGEVFTNIRYKPKVFFYFLNALLQIFVYYLPKYSFGLLAVKRKK